MKKIGCAKRSGLNKITELFQKKGIKCIEKERLEKYTTIKIGGIADLVVFPQSIEDVIYLLDICYNENIKFFLLGGGSNLLINDREIKGVVVVLRDLKGIELVKENGEEVIVRALAGTMVNNFLRFCLKHELTGLEFLAGVPATIGGAVKMNAGAFGKEISEIVKKIKLWEGNEIFWYEPKENDWEYRNFKKEGVILEVELSLKKENKGTVGNKIKKIMRERLKKQPLGKRTFGSVFKNPQGDFAGRLIEECGLKGKRIGDACFSPKHANFIENLGKATFDDVNQLIKIAQKEVFKKFNIFLEPEVKVWD